MLELIIESRWVLTGGKSDYPICPELRSTGAHLRLKFTQALNFALREDDIRTGLKFHRLGRSKQIIKNSDQCR